MVSKTPNPKQREMGSCRLGIRKGGWGLEFVFLSLRVTYFRLIKTNVAYMFLFACLVKVQFPCPPQIHFWVPPLIGRDDKATYNRNCLRTILFPLSPPSQKAKRTIK